MLEIAELSSRLGRLDEALEEAAADAAAHSAARARLQTALAAESDGQKRLHRDVVRRKRSASLRAVQTAAAVSHAAEQRRCRVASKVRSPSLRGIRFKRALPLPIRF